LDLGRSEIEASGDFSGLGEAGDGVGVFDFGEKVRTRKIDVLNFVVTLLDAL